MSFVEGLRCRECARAYPAQALHVCEWCFGPLEVVYDYAAIAAHVTRERIESGPATIWRYADLLPADSTAPVVRNARRRNPRFNEPDVPSEGTLGSPNRPISSAFRST